ncbi:MAG: hypothetical protein GDA46_00240 [Bdellovibrionales bacterium]|nr:hypothetical protein [Bdellovibrionales bacterium]
MFLMLISCGKKLEFHRLSLQSQVNSNQNFIETMELETFELSNNKAIVDFLILPDASESMFHRLKNFGNSLSDLLYVISDYDWQIGFTSTDHGDYDYKGYQEDGRTHTAQGQGLFGTLMNLEDESHFLKTQILTPQIFNYKNVFLHTLSHIPDINCNRPPFCSNPMEQPLRSLKSAIRRSFLENRSLFRKSSVFFISLLITNEEERKEDFSRATRPEEVISEFETYFQDTGKRFIHYSIVIKDQECLNLEKKHDPSATISSLSIKLSELTGGESFSLCNENYGSKLRVLSKHIKNKVENSILLKKEPALGSVSIEFLTGPNLEWKIDGRQITFENKNFEKSTVSVSYHEKK